MKKVFKQTMILMSLVFILILPYFVFAADDSSSALGKLQSVAEGSGNYSAVDETSFAGYLGVIVSVFLSLLGIIFVILIIYAGYNWMTASGEADKVEKAKKTITRAVIGVIITISAYAIWSFIRLKLGF